MANHVDGSIVIDTELNPEGFKKGSDGLEKALKSLSSKMDSLGPTFDKALKGNAKAIQTFEGKVKSLETTIGDLERKMEALGESRVPTDEYKWLTAEIEKARKKLIDLEEKQIKFEDTGVKKNSKAWKNLQYDIDLAKSKIQDYENEQAFMRDSGTAFEIGADTAEYAQLDATLATLKSRLAELRAGSAQTKTGIAGFLYTLRSASPLSEQFKQALTGIPKIASQIRASLKSAGVSIKYVFTHPIKSINQLLGSTRAGIRYLGKETLKHVGSTCKNAFKSASKSIFSFRKQTNGASKSASKFGGSLNQIKRMLGQMLIFRAFTAVLTSAKEGLDNLSKYSTKTNSDLSAFKSSLTQLKNSFATAFAPILSVVTPILTSLINHLSTAVTYVGKLVAALTGAKSFTKATAVQEDYAASLDKTAKSAEKAERQLMGFDKINKLDDKSSNSNSGSGNANVSDMFEEVPIESNITDFAEQLKTSIENSDYEGVGELLAQKLNSVVDKINKAISWESVEPKATAFVNGFTGTFNSLVDNVDWTLIGNTVGEGINTVVNTVHLLVTGIDWKDIGTAFSDGINGFITTVDWGNISDTLSKSVSGALDTISSTLQNIDWQDLARKTAEFIKGIDWSDMASSLFEVIGSALGGLSAYIGTLLSDAWKGFTNYWDQYIDWGATPSEIVEGLWQGIKDAISNVGTWLYDNVWVPFRDGFKEAFGINSPSTKMAELAVYIIEGLLVGLGDIWSKVKQKFEDFKTKLTQWFADKKADIEEAWNNFISGIKDVKATITAKVEEAKDSAREKISEAWSTIKDKSSTLKAKVEETKDSLREKVSKSWSNIKTKTSTLTASVKDAKNSLREKVSSSWSSIKTKTSTLTAKAVENGKTKLATIKSYWSSISSKTAKLSMTVTDKVTSFVSKVVNSIVNTLNKFIRAINKLPGVDVSEIPVQKFAKGGIVNSATLSLVGEAGKEAVIPLERNTGWMKVMAQAIASEIASDSFGVQRIDISYEFDETLVSGIRSVSYEFLERLQAIANSVTFTMPVATQQSVPYAVAAYVEGSPDIGTIIENSNDELATTVTRAIAAATASIVEAIEKQGSNDGLTDTANVTSKVIQEINRIKRVTGKSPINS